jgi:hypothetical protein
MTKLQAAIETIQNANIDRDELLDYSCEIVVTPAQARRRDRNFELDTPHCQCEICGKPLPKGPTVTVDGSHLGPTCTVKIAALIG